MKEETMMRAWKLISARGGKARARNLTAEQQTAHAKKAVAAREAKRAMREGKSPIPERGENPNTKS